MAATAAIHEGAGAPPTPEHIRLIRERYLAETGGDAVEALDRALADALADLCAAERRARQRDHLVSRGYARRGSVGGEARL